MARFDLIEKIKELDMTFGIELEYEGTTRDKCRKAVADAVGSNVPAYGAVRDRQSRSWQVVNDASLSYTGKEIVSPILGWDDIELVQEIVRSLRTTADCIATANCGIHVHVGSKHFDDKSLARLMSWIYHNDNYIERCLGIRPSRRSSMTKPAQKSVVEKMVKIARSKSLGMTQIEDAWYEGYTAHRTENYHSSRYHGVNLHAHWRKGTIEFRWFNGTTHAGEVKAYIQFCLAIAVKALVDKAIRMPKQREFNVEKSKYDMRVLTLGLNMIGPEFKTARNHLLENMQGSSAWAYTRPNGGSTGATVNSEGWSHPLNTTMSQAELTAARDRQNEAATDQVYEDFINPEVLAIVEDRPSPSLTMDGILAQARYNTRMGTALTNEQHQVLEMARELGI